MKIIRRPGNNFYFWGFVQPNSALVPLCGVFEALTENPTPILLTLMTFWKSYTCASPNKSWIADATWRLIEQRKRIKVDFYLSPPLKEIFIYTTTQGLKIVKYDQLTISTSHDKNTFYYHSIYSSATLPILCWPKWSAHARNKGVE